MRSFRQARSGAFALAATRGALVLAGLAAVTAPVHAQVFKCVDLAGRITYQQSPCSPLQNGSKVQLNPESAVSVEQPTDIEASWRNAAQEHRVVAGMPKRWVQQALGQPIEIRAGRGDEKASEVWTYPRTSAITQVGFAGGNVSWSRNEPVTTRGQGAPAGDDGASLERIVAGADCVAAIAQAGTPSRQQPVRIANADAAMGAVDAVQYVYEPRTGSPLGIAFTCLGGRVVEVQRLVTQ